MMRAVKKRTQQATRERMEARESANSSTNDQAARATHNQKRSEIAGHYFVL
jgi:hypothetical protein